MSPDRIDVFATAVLRNISNSAQAIAAIGEGAGCTISLLSNADEAHLGFVGASSRGTLDDGALIDIGGGSTEITVIENGINVARCGFYYRGSLSSYKRFVGDILPTQNEISAIDPSVPRLLPPTKPAPLPLRPRTLRCRWLHSRAYQEVNAWVVPGASSEEITRNDVNRMLRDVVEHRRAFIDAVLHVSPEQIHTIVCGLAILVEVPGLDGESLHVR